MVGKIATLVAGLTFVSGGCFGGDPGGAGASGEAHGLGACGLAQSICDRADADRVALLDSMPGASTCFLAELWIDWMYEYTAPPRFESAGTDNGYFAEVCEAHLTEAQALCVLYSAHGLAAECCMHGTPAHVPDLMSHGSSTATPVGWTIEECRERGAI